MWFIILFFVVLWFSPFVLFLFVFFYLFLYLFTLPFLEYTPFLSHMPFLYSNFSFVLHVFQLLNFINEILPRFCHPHHHPPSICLRHIMACGVMWFTGPFDIFRLHCQMPITNEILNHCTHFWPNANQNRTLCLRNNMWAFRFSFTQKSRLIWIHFLHTQSEDISFAVLRYFRCSSFLFLFSWFFFS